MNSETFENFSATLERVHKAQKRANFTGTWIDLPSGRVYPILAERFNTERAS